MSLWRRIRREASQPAVEETRSTYSVANPALAELFGFGTPNLAGVSVNESTALGLSAVYRAVSLVSGACGSLPLRTIREVDGQKERARSFLDSPGGPDGPTAFEWKETVLLHLLLHGNAFLAHVRGGAGQMIALVPFHPLAVTVEVDDSRLGGKRFDVTLANGEKSTFDAGTMTHIPAATTDGIKGLSVIAVARNSFGTSIAADRSASRWFSNGAMVSGLITPEADITEDEAKELKSHIRSKMQGEANAGDIAFINRSLKFTPLQLSAEDAQFLESRQFQVEEISRWFGVPPHLLSQTEKQTSWGAGVSEQNRGLARYTLEPWTTRIEQRLSRLLPNGKTAEFDYTAFVQSSPEVEIKLLIEQMNAGLITPNEARKIRNLPGLEGGDVPRVPLFTGPSGTPTDGGDTSGPAE